MRRLVTLAGVLLLVIAAMAGAAACDDDDESQASAEEVLCARLEGFGAALAHLQAVALDPQATSEERSDAVEGVRTTGQEVGEAAQDVREADAQALETAADNLRGRVQNISPDATPAQAKAAIQPQLQALLTAWREVFDGAGCTAGDSTS